MPSLLLIATVTILFLTWLLLSFYKKNRCLPPGPRGLPMLGYYPFLSNKPYLDYAKLAKNYGNVFSHRTLGGKLVVVLNGVDLIKEIYINRAEEFLGRIQESHILTWISDGLGMSQEEGPVWKEHRRFFLQTAKNFGFGKQESEELIHTEIKTLIHDLKKEAGKVSNVRFHIAYATSSIISTILFSTKFEKYKAPFPEIAKSAKYLLEMVPDQRYILVGPIYQHIIMKFFPSTKRIRKARECFRKVVEDIVDDHIKSFNPDNIRDYIDGYLYQAYKLGKNGEKHSFTVERLKSISFNLLMEGTEPGTICHLLDEASRHVEEQKLVQKELDSIVGRERLPSWSDKKKLVYLDAFTQELYRLHMAFNLSSHHCNYKETIINGFRIPARTIIVANLWTINNDSTLFPEPSKFDPKRYIGEDGKRIKTEGPYPFGVGKRSCVGESLAKMEVFFIIASLLQNFTLYPAGKLGYLKLIPRD